MVFSSIIFLFIFLPVTLLIYFAVPRAAKNPVLLIASIFFYAWGEPVYVFLMLFSAVFNYFMGLDIFDRRHDHHLAKNSLIFTIIINLLMLGFFKYYGFAIETFNGIFGTDFAHRDLALPIGISFYTFQALSYIIDVYRRNIDAQRNFISFCMYLTLFPQLIAGPIVKYKDIEHQLKDRQITMAGFGEGVECFIKGLAKKVLLANNLGLLHSAIVALPGDDLSVLSAWLGIIGYTLQIYFDFSGYSDMAIGLGKMLGFDYMQNFNYPYISKTITEFWRRWHISLSTWFREYLYIPLGGNRVPWYKHLRNIFVVWFLTGLWHGASWNFVVWGLYYAVFLVLEKYLLKKPLEKAPSFVSHIYTMLIVTVDWVFFCSPDLGSALSYIGDMFGSSGVFADAAGLYYLRSFFLFLLIGGICSVPAPQKAYRMIAASKPKAAIIIDILLFILCIAYLVYDTYNPFLYFRF